MKNTKKILSLALVLILSLGIFAACGDKPAVVGEGTEKIGGELNLYTWEGVFPDEVLRGFTERTGVKINYSNFDTDEAMLAKLQADKKGSYDIVIADDYIIKTAIEESLVTKLEKDKISNIGNVDPAYQGQFFDPTDEYTVPYGAGVQTIVYNPEVIKLDIKGYEDLWDASLKNDVGIIGNFRVINGMALKTMGESYNTQDVDVIKAAGLRLNELAPNIRTITDDGLQDKLLTGEVNAAIMYTSQVTQAKMVNPNLKVVFPEEGIGFGIMGEFIPANAPNPEAAYAFIDYILEPEIAAQCYEFLGYYSTNKAANEFISPEYIEFLTLPAEIDTKSMEMIQPIGGEAEDAHSLVWTEFQASR